MRRQITRASVFFEMISRCANLIDHNPNGSPLLEFPQVSVRSVCVGVGLGRVPGLVGGWPGLTDWPQPLTSPEIVSRCLARFSCISISEFSSLSHRDGKYATRQATRDRWNELLCVTHLHFSISRDDNRRYVEYKKIAKKTLHIVYLRYLNIVFPKLPLGVVPRIST